MFLILTLVRRNSAVFFFYRCDQRGRQNCFLPQCDTVSQCRESIYVVRPRTSARLAAPKDSIPSQFKKRKSFFGQVPFHIFVFLSVVTFLVVLSLFTSYSHVFFFFSFLFVIPCDCSRFRLNSNKSATATTTEGLPLFVATAY